MSEHNVKEKILVTGGAGFVGGHLVDALILRGYDVAVLDSLAKPTHDGELPPWFNTKAAFICGDVTIKDDWVRALSGVSVVFHLAGYMDFLPDYSRYYDVNTKSAALLYEVINEKKFPITKIFFASSQAVYGEGKYECAACGIMYPQPRKKEDLDQGIWEIQCPNGHGDLKSLPGAEADRTIVHNPYSISKRALEDTSVFLGNHLSIPSYALRYTIVHGSRQSVRHFYSGALRQFVSMVLARKPISMHEDGQQKRDFVHIDDVIAAHLFLLEHSEAIPGIYNIGSGESTTVMELAQCVAKTMGVPYEQLLRGEYRVGNARHYVADISKLKGYGWKPTKTLLDNVTDYVAWVKSEPSILETLKQGAEKISDQDPIQPVR